jgi:hypothetical protein
MLTNIHIQIYIFFLGYHYCWFPYNYLYCHHYHYNHHYYHYIQYMCGSSSDTGIAIFNNISSSIHKEFIRYWKVNINVHVFVYVCMYENTYIRIYMNTYIYRYMSFLTTFPVQYIKNSFDIGR